MERVVFDLAKQAGLALDRYPYTNEELDLAEDVMEEALSKLSLDKREKIIFDIHGIPTIEYKDPKTLSSLLKEMNTAINKIKNKEAYEHALFLNESYVRNRDFQLLFLRIQDFNVVAAANMIVAHFEVKRSLFEDNALARNVRQSDLSDDDLKVLHAGFCQILPKRDLAGRAIIAVDSDFVSVGDPKRLERTVFYMDMTFLQDEGIRKDGTIWVIQNMHHRFVDYQSYMTISKIQSVIPLRTKAGHFCGGKNFVSRILFAGMKMFSFDGFRYTSHFGGWDEVAFQLQTYGIPTELLPVDEHGIRSTSNHLQWLKEQHIQEDRQSQAQDLANCVIIPNHADVLFGKSQKAKSAFGTLRARYLVELNYDDYVKKRKYEKTDVANKIIRTIKEAGGRFLKRNEKEGGWEIVEDLAAREKISHWFRHTRAKGRTLERDDSNFSLCVKGKVRPLSQSTQEAINENRFSNTNVSPSDNMELQKNEGQ